MLNWIVWIRTVWLNRIAWNRIFLPLNCVLMLNWIVWGVVIFDIEPVLTLNWIFEYGTVLTFNCV